MAMPGKVTPLRRPPYPGPSVVTKTSGCFFGSQASGPVESKLFSSVTPSLVARGVAQLSSADAHKTGDSNIAPMAASAASQHGQRRGVVGIAVLPELRVAHKFAPRSKFVSGRHRNSSPRLRPPDWEQPQSCATGLVFEDRSPRLCSRLPMRDRA